MAVYKLRLIKWSHVFAMLAAVAMLVFVYNSYFFSTSGTTTCGKPFQVYKRAFRPFYLVLVKNNSATPDNGSSAYLVSSGELDLLNASQIHGTGGIKMENPDAKMFGVISVDSEKHGPARKLSWQDNHILFEDFDYCQVEFAAGN